MTRVSPETGGLASRGRAWSSWTMRTQGEGEQGHHEGAPRGKVRDELRPGEGRRGDPREPVQVPGRVVE